jgi:dienelactone hydrolase
MYPIESLLSARLFVAPKLVGGRIYFISNMSGKLSLYVMDDGGSVPEPLLPPDIALQNPTLMNGELFVVLPDLERILVMIDQDGNEVYKPHLIPLTGGYPEPFMAETFANYRLNCVLTDVPQNIVYLWAERLDKPLSASFQVNVATAEAILLGESPYGYFPAGHTADHSRVLVGDAYGAGDQVMFIQTVGETERHLLYGVPIEERQPGQHVPPNSLAGGYFVAAEQGLLVHCAVFSDSYGLAYMSVNKPQEMHPVTMSGVVHEGTGELEGMHRLADNRFLLQYNIDGCHWLYEGVFESALLNMRLERVIAGQSAPLQGGIHKGLHYDKATGRYVLAYTTAVSPAQLFTVEPKGAVRQHTRERVLGLPAEHLSAGEDASFTSFDGLRVSARLYLPTAELNHPTPYPVVFYIHGGPQSQEHPDFAWFSMPLIQQLTLRGMAVFVPNVRGSTGYGFEYMSKVVRNWGGEDRLDHVHALTEVLSKDARLDTTRAGVVGRSYGGYMTLTLATRHAELWKAAVDMFGPYDLPNFADRVPESWKPHMAALVGDPITERDFLLERSPITYLDELACPLLVIQGKNDPRVVEAESAELVAALQGKGKRLNTSCLRMRGTMC